MRRRAAIPVLVLPVLLGACVAMRSQEATVESTVALGPGGRVEGRVAVPAGAECEIELENQGPGRADYVIRVLDGDKLASGALHETSAGVESASALTLVVVVEAYDDAGTTVECELEAPHGVSVDWDLSRAFRKVESK